MSPEVDDLFLGSMITVKKKSIWDDLHNFLREVVMNVGHPCRDHE